MSDSVHVAVAVIVNENNDVCLSLRHKDAHQGGLWEFPGGKIEHGETVSQSLEREIKEELNICIDDSRPLITVPHSYKDKNVYLHVNRILSYHGQAVGVEGQEITWVAIKELSSYDFPAANEAIVKAIQLPDRYLITGKFLDEKDFLKKLSAALDSGIKLVQLRLKHDALDKHLDKKALAGIIQQSSDLCLQADAKLLFNIPENI
ncbi:MAG: 8-oxo-dGTP diphosphatase MutT, partial [Gammaproteobacteria bacterium]|nr:8-oxo-dGTP diphosphatase MutT [Gammaproteobacteria bacterium]